MSGILANNHQRRWTQAVQCADPVWGECIRPAVKVTRTYMISFEDVLWGEALLAKRQRRQ